MSLHHQPRPRWRSMPCQSARLVDVFGRWACGVSRSVRGPTRSPSARHPHACGPARRWRCPGLATEVTGHARRQPSQPTWIATAEQCRRRRVVRPASPGCWQPELAGVGRAGRALATPRQQLVVGLARQPGRIAVRPRPAVAEAYAAVLATVTRQGTRGAAVDADSLGRAVRGPATCGSADRERS